MKRLRHSLTARIAGATLAAALLAIAVIAVALLAVAAELFRQLMMQHGASEASAQAMYDQTVVSVFALAAVAAALGALILGAVLAGMINRPLRRVGAAARRLANGDFSVRVPRPGTRELASVADSFNQLAEALGEEERQRAEMVANFAHELRTPLTNLRGYLEAMRDGVMAPTPAVFESLREEVDRLERLSRSLDALSGDGAEGTAQELDLAAAVRSAADLARPALERAGLGLRVETGAAPLRVAAVPDHLSQVLANLLQNAQRYTAAGGQVVLKAATDGDTVLVAISNTGPDISAGDLPHLFERFYRVDRSRDRAHGGAGIGLAIVKQLVEAAGGRVGAESGGGSTRFWFRLPAV
ncbi:MAG: ATP-binding protein [Candidatus Dormibacteraeota bacterium]|nr:ATP-binding protein [Candidatus Dormibacteraeota bacterium]